ncbi:hypothetical protein WME75_07550 [Sorangium sp. So ce1014]
MAVNVGRRGDSGQAFVAGAEGGRAGAAADAQPEVSRRVVPG